MKLLRVRFTVRRLIAAVAVVALLMTASLAVSPGISRRWNACQAAANRQTQVAQMAMASAAMSIRMGAVEQAARSREKVALHQERSRKNWWAFFDPFHECIFDHDIY